MDGYFGLVGHFGVVGGHLLVVEFYFVVVGVLFGMGRRIWWCLLMLVGGVFWIIIGGVFDVG